MLAGGLPPYKSCCENGENKSQYKLLFGRHDNGTALMRVGYLTYSSIILTFVDIQSPHGGLGRGQGQFIPLSNRARIQKEKFRNQSILGNL